MLSFLHRHRFLFSALALFLLLIIALGLWVAYQLRRIEPILKARIVTQLSERFHARVELDQFHISLLQGLAAEGSGLRIWPPDENTSTSQNWKATSSPTTQPLIQLSHFSFHTEADFKHLAIMVIQNQGQLRIPSIELKGLSIHIPPHSHFAHPSTEPSTSTPHTQLTFIIDKIVCTQASLVLETDKPHKDPLEFTIDSLTLTNLAPNTPLQFEATLTIPRPSGPIHTTGTLGPIATTDLGEAPITGDYSLTNADLSVFKGIAGTLASTGHYSGTPRALDVVGETTIPDFRLTHFGNQLPLTTHFTALVDATNGDTSLSTVTATLAHSHFSVHGQILRIQNTPGSKAPNGHDINLITASTSSRIEDFLRLTSNKPTSLITGTTAFNATFHLPPGPAHVHERMQINGTFHLTDAHFTNPKVQRVIMELSLRGQGRPDEIKTTDPSTIDSAVSGDIHIMNGLVTLPNLVYSVPGAAIDMKGTYLLDGGQLNFDGSAKLDAPISKLIGGKFGKFLKPADKFLKKEGAGTFVPIHITGDREDPHFTIDFDKLLKP